MQHIPSRHLAGGGVLLGLLMASAAVQADQGRFFSIDIAGDCNRFITEGKGHLDPELNPVFGDNFVQEGIIYPGGTFETMCPETLDCGLTEDGEPEFPEKVIGKWTCYGAFIGDGLVTEAGSWVVSTQVYDFGAERVEKADESPSDVFTPGVEGLVSHGTERVDFEPFKRAVTGGFGRFKNVRGDVEQVKVAFNQTTCENFTFTFRIQPRIRPNT